MQNICKYYAKKIAKIMQKVLKKLCKKDTVMHCTLIYTWTMPDMVKYRVALWSVLKSLSLYFTMSDIAHKYAA